MIKKNKVKLGDLVVFTEVDPMLLSDQLIQLPDGSRMITNNGKVISLTDPMGVEMIENYSPYELEVSYDR